jgi:cold shock CspA family protein
MIDNILAALAALRVNIAMSHATEATGTGGRAVHRANENCRVRRTTINHQPERIETMRGTVKRISRDSYGFIEPDDYSGDVFFHFRDFERAALAPPRVGDVIEFESVPSPRGRKVNTIEQKW